MALIWAASEGDTRYEVRRAGRTHRLYTNGVFHSQFNDAQPVTGAVWDLLMLPVFFGDVSAIRRVLVLGVGGGAAIRQLQRFVRPHDIVGIELDAMHIRIARQFFGVDDSVELLHADANAWLDQYRGPAFDLVIDDLFGSDHSGPQRAFAPNASWCSQLLKVLAPNGMLVMNCVAPRELRSCALLHEPEWQLRFPSCFELRSEVDSNAVGAFLPFEVRVQQLRRNLRAVPELDPARKSARLRFTIRQLA